MTVGEISPKNSAFLAVARPNTHRQPEIIGWALPLYMLLLCGGFAFLRSPMATARGGELSIDRAAFTSINVVTGTGFSQSIALDGLTPLGRGAIVVMIGCGSLLTLSVGGILVSLGARLDHSEKSIVFTALTMLVASACIGAVSLSDSAGHGAMQGIGAISNCGLVLIGSLRGLDHWSCWVVLLPLMTLGGFGVPVLMDFVGRLRFGKKMSQHTTTVLAASAVTYLVATAALFLVFRTPAGTASMLAINSRSAGFDLSPLGSITRSGWWFIMLLMAIGAAPGGAGGGVKVTLPSVVWQGAVDCYRRRMPSRSFAIAMAWLGFFLLIVFSGTLALVALQPQVPGDRALFIVISAATNTGLSVDPITMVGAPLYVLGAIALVGRAVPFLVLWWWCQQAGEAEAAAVG